ncbi:hypothetical protein IPM09_01980 [Candidatus Saccharibacteria bacterium]|nr:MAG: hypothetical protein IPM09_01980 [Candidatus Saccharibacteria bacterium]
MLFVTGYHASGKSEISKILVNDFNLLHIETSALVRQAHHLDAPHMPLGAWAKRMEHDYGSTVFDDLIADTTMTQLTIDADRGWYYDDIVISGNRSYDGISYITERLREYGAPIRHEQSILLIETPIEALYDRFRQRDREEGDKSMSFEEFITVMDAERDRGIEAIIEHATHRINNSGGTRALRDSIYTFARDARYTPREPHEDERFRHV